MAQASLEGPGGQEIFVAPSGLVSLPHSPLLAIDEATCSAAGLASAILTKHDDNLRGIEHAFLNINFELAKSFRHCRVMVVQILQSLLLLDLFRG